MYALPPRLRDTTEPPVSGVSCPDCCGMLAVHVEGKRSTLVFECRFGHTFMLEELLAAKEERLDERLWTPLHRPRRVRRAARRRLRA